jgi:hypothetical protein
MLKYKKTPTAGPNFLKNYGIKMYGCKNKTVSQAKERIE